MRLANRTSDGMKYLKKDGIALPIVKINARLNVPWYDYIYSQINPVEMLPRLKSRIWKGDLEWMARRANRQKNTIVIEYKGRKTYFNSNPTGVEIHFDAFSNNEYKRLNVENKQVIDIGGNIGDTAIYFLLNGAKEVLSYEIVPELHEQAEINIKLNHLEDRIKPNLAEVRTLDSLPISKDADLKMDIEGAEYDVLFNSSPKTIQKFSEIIIEYHYGYLNLKKLLEKLGFKVHISRARRGMENNRGIVGILYAKRIND